MARILPSQAKVVHKSVLTVLLLFAYYITTSQDRKALSTSDPLTFGCNSCSFLNLLNDLERKSGLHFIYSTNIIDVNKLVSFKANEQPIEEVLRSLGESMDLVFKRNGQHIVIKKPGISSTSSAGFADRKTSSNASLISNPEKKLSATSGTIKYNGTEVTGSSATSGESEPVLGEIVIRKPPVTLSDYFDARKFSALPAYTIRTLNLKNNHPGWFVSGGFVLNDYSAGAEFRGGLRSVFVVFRPSWLKDGRYHGGYGLGTSLLLNHNLSLNTIYTFAQVKKESEKAGQAFEAIDIPDVVASSRHHQLRFMLEYALSRNISLRGGLSVNYLETTRFLGDVQFASDAGAIGFSTYAPDANTYSSMPYKRVAIRSYRPLPGEIRTSRMWMGWETSMSYKFNIYQRRR